MNLSFPSAPIDIHSHFNHGVADDYNPAKYLGLMHFDLDFLRTEYDNVGIAAGGFSSYASVLSPDADLLSENEWLANTAEQTPWIYQWVVVHPEKPDTFAQAKELLSRPKCLGIKIHPQYHAYDIGEYGDKIFSFAAEQGATVLMHPQKIDLMPTFADRYPEMKLIVAHLGSETHIDAIRAAKYHNIYTDTSGGMSYLNNVIEYAVNTVGSDHILFGTDTYSCAFQFGRIAFARIPDADKENILYGNARRLFPQAFANL